MTPTPIFFAYTRSFWGGVLLAAPALFDAAVIIVTDPTLHGPVSGLVAAIVGLDPARVESVLKLLAGLAPLYVAFERRGQNRPYTIDPRAT